MNAHFFWFCEAKPKKMGIHSLFSFAAGDGESLLRQPQSTAIIQLTATKEGIHRVTSSHPVRLHATASPSHKGHSGAATAGLPAALIPRRVLLTG
jgi:hypothetical protein